MRLNSASGRIIGALLALGMSWLGTPGTQAASTKAEEDFQVDNHYQRTDLYLPLGTFLVTTKEKDNAPVEGCTRMPNANAQVTTSNLFLCPRSYLLIPGRKINYLKGIRLRPYAMQETEDEEYGSYAYVKHVSAQDKSIKKSGTTPALLNIKVIEVQMPSGGQKSVKLAGKPKVLKSIDKVALKLGQDNDIPLNLQLSGQANIGVLLTTEVPADAKKAQVIYLESSDQSQLWMHKENPFVYELLPDGYAPAFSHADIRVVYK